MSISEVSDFNLGVVFNGVSSLSITIPKLKIEEFYEFSDCGLLAEGKVLKTIILNNKEFVCIGAVIRGEEIVSVCIQECIKYNPNINLSTEEQKFYCKGIQYVFTLNKIVALPEKQKEEQLLMF